ncbi:hypothetical protein MGG_15662, partial [Pyricularia oryzae 70-15]
TKVSACNVALLVVADRRAKYRVMGGVIWTCFRANGAEKEHRCQGEHRQRDELSETRPAGSSRPGRSYMMNEK